MSNTVLVALDHFFVLFHTAFTLFVAVGWSVPALRRTHRYAVAITAFSWFGLGLFTTIGYCPLTDWHWRVLRALGERDLPRSYVQYLVRRILTLDVSAHIVDWSVAVLFAIATLMAVRLRTSARRREQAGDERARNNPRR